MYNVFVGYAHRGFTSNLVEIGEKTDEAGVASAVRHISYVKHSIKVVNLRLLLLLLMVENTTTTSLIFY